MLVKAEFVRVNLDEADLSNADMTKGEFIRNSFRRANLTGADLAGSNLSRAVFHGATLHRRLIQGGPSLLGALRVHRSEFGSGPDTGAGGYSLRRR
jgi:uncharacterized protein YjbI with pentapeptide repeats